MAPDHTQFQLPLSIVTEVDVHRLQRELHAIDDFMTQSAIRQPGQQPILPKSSHNLEEIASLNRLNLLRDSHRRVLVQELDGLRRNAPTMHMSFSQDPSSIFLAKLITWLRREIHPRLLLQVGQQPSLAAGCIVRTSSKYFDFSLREHFERQRQSLIDQLKQAAV